MDSAGDRRAQRSQMAGAGGAGVGLGLDGGTDEEDRHEDEVKGVKRWREMMADDVSVVMRRRAEEGYGVKDVSWCLLGLEMSGDGRTG